MKLLALILTSLAWLISIAGRLVASPQQPSPLAGPGVLLEELTWVQAEQVLTPDTVVVIPIGAAAKEHGPHLLLRNDFLLAEGLKRRLLDRTRAVIAPTVPYHYYPVFLAYPGSTSLSQKTARDVLIDICRSLAHHGPRRFYALNTGVSTLKALAPASEELAKEGILLRYTDLQKTLAPIEKQVGQQEGGTHADEIETSMMLYLAPAAVNMSKVGKDFHKKGKGGFTRDPKGEGTYSPSGVWGDPTLATRDKGEKIVAALVDGLIVDIEALRSAPLLLPPPTAVPPTTQAPFSGKTNP